MAETIKCPRCGQLDMATKASAVVRQGVVRGRSSFQANVSNSPHTIDGTSRYHENSDLAQLLAPPSLPSPQLPYAMPTEVMLAGLILAVCCGGAPITMMVGEGQANDAVGPSLAFA